MRDSSGRAADDRGPEGVLSLGSSGIGAANAGALKGLLIDDVLQRVAANKGIFAPHKRDMGDVVKDSQIDALCDALMSEDAASARRLIRAVQGSGVSADALYLDYIAAAARRMGDRWVADCSSFVDVTLAGGRLFSLVRDLAPAFTQVEQAPLKGHRILIAPVPGETHSLGSAIAAEYFRRSRWDVTLMNGASMLEIQDAMGARRFPVVGLSAGSRRMLDPLHDTVRAVRAAHPDAVICIGGHILDLEPDVASMVDADYAGADSGALAILLRRRVFSELHAMEGGG